MDIMGSVSLRRDEKDIRLIDCLILAQQYGVKVGELYKIYKNGRPIMTQAEAYSVSRKLAERS